MSAYDPNDAAWLGVGSSQVVFAFNGWVGEDETIVEFPKTLIAVGRRRRLDNDDDVLIFLL